MNAHFNRWGLGNAYGAFGSMSEVRHEIAIEGTLDPSGTDGWREYVFKGKPGEVHRRGPVVAPYHLRLDWLMWFAALGDYRDAWFLALIERLGTGDPLIRRLLGPDPFDGRAPALIRARMFTYRYATSEERRAAKQAGETPPWWVRSDPRVILRPVDLRGR